MPNTKDLFHLHTRPLIPTHCPFCGSPKTDNISFACRTFRIGYGNTNNSQYLQSDDCKLKELNK